MKKHVIRLPKDKNFVQLIKYALVGFASNLIGYLIYLTLTYSGLTPKATMTALYFVGAVVGFIGNKKWTFKSDGNDFSLGVRYLIAHFIGYLLNFMILFAFVDINHFPHQWVQAIAIFVVAIYLFIAFKFVVFRN